MKHARVVCLLLAISLTTIKVTQAQKPCTGASFLRELNKRMICGVFKTFPSNAFDCRKLCSTTLKCFGVNTFTKTNGNEICEFVSGTQRSFGEERKCLVHTLNSEYNELTSTTVSCSPAGGCPKQAAPTKAALPDGWYQFGSSAFKLFKINKTWESAKGTCTSNGASLASIENELENRFVAEVLVSQLKENVFEDTPLKPLKHWKLDGSDSDVILYGNATYDQVDPSLNLPGMAGAYATTPAFPIQTTSFTIALWLKVETCLNKNYYIYSYWKDPILFTMFVMGDATSCRLEFRARQKTSPQTNILKANGNQNVLGNKWTHCAVTWDRGNKKLVLYKDGVMQVSQLVSEADVDLPISIRSVFDVGLKRDNLGTIKGKVKNIVVFNSALTKDDVILVRDTTQKKIGAWIGPPAASYNNWVPVLQQTTSSNCFFIDRRKNQWDKHSCGDVNNFICKRRI